MDIRACGCSCNPDYTLTCDGSKCRCECNGNATGMLHIVRVETMHIVDIVIAMCACIPVLNNKGH